MFHGYNNNPAGKKKGGALNGGAASKMIAHDEN